LESGLGKDTEGKEVPKVRRRGMQDRGVFLGIGEHGIYNGKEAANNASGENPCGQGTNRYHSPKP